MELHPQQLNGPWTEGYALDFHTISSKPVEYAKKMVEAKDPVTGKMVKAEMKDKGKVIKWETTYTPLGLEMHHLKYWGESGRLNLIAQEAAAFLIKKSGWKIDLIIPVPPSNTHRHFQPVEALAKILGDICKLAVDTKILIKLKPTSPVKDIEIPAQRAEMLKGVFDIAQNALGEMNVLIFDDLYRSGETLHAVTEIVKNKGNAKNVYVLTITKTRIKK
jgi:predicted amidophosphoribosyltransferase